MNIVYNEINNKKTEITNSFVTTYITKDASYSFRESGFQPDNEMVVTELQISERSFRECD